MKKSRHLSIYDFLEILQLEYLTAELRKKIYRKDDDIAYYSKVMKFKKQKILDISKRNTLPCIFDNEETKYNMYDKIYNSTGYPKFVYRDEEDRLTNEIKDKRHYYAKGSEVKVSSENNEIIIGEIYKVNLEKGIIFVKPRGESKEAVKPHPMENVMRII